MHIKSLDKYLCNLEINSNKRDKTEGSINYSNNTSLKEKLKASKMLTQV